MAKLLSILLQKSDPSLPWGFYVCGGAQDRAQLVIDHVEPGALASQYLSAGDSILQIEKSDTRMMTRAAAEALIDRPARSLDLLVMKGSGRREARVNPEVKRTEPEIKWVNPEVARTESPFRNRREHWRRSEERRKFEESMFSDGEERSRDSEKSFQSRVDSVWSPTPERRERWERGGQDDRQGNVTFWEMTPESHYSESRSSSRSGTANKPYRRQNSDLSLGYSSLTSEYASTPKTHASFDFNDAFVKTPSDIWDDHFREGRARLNSFSGSFPAESSWKNANVTSKTEFKQSTSVSEKSYSDKEGAKSFETYEHVNKVKETEKTTKTGEGGKEEVVEKTKKNKEYVLANRDDVNGETKKVINDFKVVERVKEGDQEYCNRHKERSEEVTNSATPVNFYDNVRDHGVVEGPNVGNAEWCEHPVKRKAEVKFVDGSDDSDSIVFSPLLGRGSSSGRWASSTPLPEEPNRLQENYLEVDIRSPVHTQVFFSAADDLRRQSSQISGGGSPTPVSPQGGAPPPPPLPPTGCPPPPPPFGPTGALPSTRLSTEIPDKRRSAYEPPAAIQNAMMTKDKKPFTYTPGGLDLSEIRSPRMARRMNRNANAPDLAPPPPRPSPLSGQPLPPSAVAAMQPQIAVSVLPQGGFPMQQSPGGHYSPPAPPPQPQKFQPSPQPSSPQKTLPSPPPPQRLTRQPSPPLSAAPKLQPQHRHTRSEPDPSPPGSIYVPPVESLPRAQLGSLYIPPLAPVEQPKPQSPASQLNKGPTPWMSRQPQVQNEVPPWVNREQNNQQNSSPQPILQSPQQQTRIIPIQIQMEGQSQQQSQPNTRIIPIQLEGTPSPQHSPAQAPNYNQQQQQQQQQYQQQQYQQQQQQPRWMNQQPVYVHNKFSQGSQSPAPTEQDNVENWRQSQSNGVQSPGPAPVQSRSFKVLEKITGSDQPDAPYNSQGVPLSQLRKMQLSDDDRALMNKVKTQVDDETYLHKESDPRYRGSAIPSRAFRILQTMTDSADGSDVPQSYGPVQTGQNRLGNRTPQPSDGLQQQYIPASEQQVQEPRKYTGGAIPSRSFRMLQAMTAGSDSAVMSDGRQTPQFSNGGEALWAPYPPHTPDPYYFQPPSYPPQTPEEQQQFWEHYNAMCAYMAGINQNYACSPYAYPPHLYTPPPLNFQYASDSDECGYSSTDEMNYYGAYFKKYPPPIQPYRGYYQEQRAQTPQIIITPSNMNGNVYQQDTGNEQGNSSVNSSPSVNGDSEGTTDDGSDTEVEEDMERPQRLQTIKSVPDISIYKDSSASDIQSQNSETDEPDEDELNYEVHGEYEDENSLPHQLSVIYEESDFSESESCKKVKRKEDLETASEGESSTATLDNGEDTDDDDVPDSDNALVHVRLPLKLQFSKTENNEEVTTVTVGNSEIQSSPEVEIQPEELIVTEIIKDEPDPEVSVTFKIPKKKSPIVEETVSHRIDINGRNLDLKQSESIKTAENNDVESICDKEISVVVSISDTNNDKNNRGYSESPVDFWKVLSSDDIPARATTPADVSISVTLPPKSLTKSGSRSPYENLTSESDESKPEESDCHWEDDSSSTSVQTVRIGQFSGSDQFSGSEVEVAGTADEVEDLHRVISESDKISEKDNLHFKEEQDDNGDEQEKIPIEDLLYDESSSSDEDDDESSSSSSSSSSSEESSEQSKEVEETVSLSVDSSKGDSKTDDDVFCTENSKSEVGNLLHVEQKSRKVFSNSCKSQDESEEDDSGVTSDMSRHISETDTDPECGSELRKLTPYQRAATHSRLFKLLQDECGTEEEGDTDNKTVETESLCTRKERLTLPLHTAILSDPESMSSSSGINSPSSPTVSDRLVKELVQSLLHKRKGRHFRKLPMEKLYAAAYRILQEDMDPYDTVSSTSDESFRHSPINESTANQTNNNTTVTTPSHHDVYGANYYDYCDYYNTWGNPYYYSNVEDSLGYDIVPSRAFKILQERAQTPHGFSSGVIEGLTAKCPRVLSSKDVPRDVNDSQTPESNPQASPSSET